MPDALIASLEAALAAREAEGLARRRRTIGSRAGPRVTIDGRELLSFAGNDYLGLAGEPALADAAAQAARRWGVGATASHLVCGHCAAHEALERELADWVRPCEGAQAVTFSTGYLANLAIVSALADRGTEVHADRLNHACLNDGALLARSRLVRYPHRDVDALARRLAASRARRKLIATDAVFSMDGDVAPLADLAALCRRDGATLMVDEAHGLGVLGPHGAGSIAAAGLSQDDAPILMATLGKALGCMGAFVAGSRALIEGLTQFARSFVYTTALPPALAAAGAEAVRIARDEDWRREKLQALIGRFRAGAAQLGLPLVDSRSAIQPLIIGEAVRAGAASRALAGAGFLVTAIRPPTVPQGKARLRVTLSTAHSEADVDRLLDALATLRLGTSPDNPSPT